MVTCEVRNRFARSTTRTLPSCCIVSMMARRRSSLSRLFPSTACTSRLSVICRFLLYRTLWFVHGTYRLGCSSSRGCLQVLSDGKPFYHRVHGERRGKPLC